jgi:hypothetical protein
MCNVQRQLMSGKEATVKVLRCADDRAVPTVHKEAITRTLRLTGDHTGNCKAKRTC